MDEERPDITAILGDVSHGRADAARDLLPLVYEELRALAASRLQRERPDHTLQPTALVHEAYLRLIGQTRITWRSRAHFFAAAANAIRRILVDSARRRGAAKRGGGWHRLEVEPHGDGLDHTELLALDDALTRLAEVDPRAARVVELRSFGGLTIQQTAEVLGIGHGTVERDWSAARAWLLVELGSGEEVG